MATLNLAKTYRLVFAAFLTGSMLFHLAILWESRGRMAAGYGDFIIFYTGAQIVNDGRSGELFNVETQNQYQAKFDVPQLEWPLPFNHAPYELFLFLPLAWLPFPIAHAIWSGFNLILLLIILRWFRSYASSADNGLIGFALLAWFPTMEVFRLGQDSVLTAGLLLGVFAALKEKRDGWAGLLLALGLYKPQLVLPLAGVLTVARRWRCLASFSVTAFVLLAVSLVMVGLRGAFDLVHILRFMSDHSFIILPSNMPNLRGLVHVVLPGDGFDTLRMIVTATISLLLYGMNLYFWKENSDSHSALFDLKFALTIVTTVLVSHHLYAHDLFPVALALVLLFKYICTDAGTPRLWSASYYALLLLLFVPVVPRYLNLNSFGVASLPFLGLLALLAAEIYRRRLLDLARPLPVSAAAWTADRR